MAFRSNCVSKSKSGTWPSSPRGWGADAVGVRPLTAATGLLAELSSTNATNSVVRAASVVLRAADVQAPPNGARGRPRGEALPALIIHRFVDGRRRGGIWQAITRWTARSQRGS